MSEFPTFTIRQLLDAGVHFGHKTMRWNPKMAPYLYGDRDGIHIIDLQQTVPMFYQALQVVSDVVRNNGRVLFVGTKRQASDIVAESAKRCGQYYVNHRWLGGMLTNWNTISVSIKTLKEMEELIEKEHVSGGGRLTKKELLELQRKHDKLQRSLGGIRDMGGKPDLLFVLDTNKEDLAVKEAHKLDIPIIGIVDSNSDPDEVNYPVPGNDDATRAIKLYCKLVSDAALHGIQQGMVESGADIGAVAGLGEENTEAEGAEEASAKKPTAKKAAVSKAKTEKAPAKHIASQKAGTSEDVASDAEAGASQASSVGEDTLIQKASNS